MLDVIIGASLYNSHPVLYSLGLYSKAHVADSSMVTCPGKLGCPFML